MVYSLFRQPKGLRMDKTRATIPQFITVQEVAERLNLCEMTVRSAITKGTLPAVRVSNRLRIPVAGVERWLAESVEPVRPPREREAA